MPFATSSQSTSSCRSVPPTKDKANFFATTMVGSDFHRLATATGRRGHIAEVVDGTVAPAPNPNPATQHPPQPTGAQVQREVLGPSVKSSEAWLRAPSGTIVCVFALSWQHKPHRRGSPRAR